MKKIALFALYFMACVRVRAVCKCLVGDPVFVDFPIQASKKILVRLNLEIHISAHFCTAFTLLVCAAF